MWGFRRRSIPPKDRVWGFRGFGDPTEGPLSVAAAKCRRVLALIDDTSLGVKQAYTNSLRGYNWFFDVAQTCWFNPPIAYNQRNLLVMFKNYILLFYFFF